MSAGNAIVLTVGRGVCHGSHPFHLGSAAFRFDFAGRVVAAEPAIRGGDVGSAGRPVRCPAGPNERAQRVFGVYRRHKRERILRELFDNFYAECTAEVIFDTNRGWCGWMTAICTAVSR